jgi:hypothetical protein
MVIEFARVREWLNFGESSYLEHSGSEKGGERQPENEPRINAGSVERLFRGPVVRIGALLAVDLRGHGRRFARVVLHPILRSTPFRSAKSRFFGVGWGMVHADRESRILV